MGGWASARNPSLRAEQAVLGPFKPKDKPEAGGSQTAEGGVMAT